MFGLGLPELIIIVFVIVLLFGAKLIPGIVKGVKEAINSFKKEKDNTDEDSNSTNS